MSRAGRGDLTGSFGGLVMQPVATIDDERRHVLEDEGGVLADRLGQGRSGRERRGRGLLTAHQLHESGGVRRLGPVHAEKALWMLPALLRLGFMLLLEFTASSSTKPLVLKPSFLPAVSQ